MTCPIFIAGFCSVGSQSFYGHSNAYLVAEDGIVRDILCSSYSQSDSCYDKCALTILLMAFASNWYTHFEHTASRFLLGFTHDCHPEH
jgi:hypothetical protein